MSKCPHCEKFIETQRTPAQNSSLHLFCSQLATVLNDMGLDMRVVLKPEYNLDWTMQSVKEHIFKPFMKIVTGKERTRDLKKADGEIEKIHETIMRELGTKHNVEYIPFPSRCQNCQHIDCIC